MIPLNKPIYEMIQDGIEAVGDKVSETSKEEDLILAELATEVGYQSCLMELSLTV